MLRDHDHGACQPDQTAQDDGKESFDVLVPVVMRVRIRAEDSLAAEVMAEEALREAEFDLPTDGGPRIPARVESILKPSVA